MKFPARPRYFALDIVGGVLAFLVVVPLGTVFVVEGLSSWAPEPASLVLYVIVAVILFFAGTVARWMPGPALVIAWGGAVIQMFAGLWPSVIDLPILSVLFATAAWGSRRLMWAGGISTVAGSIIAGLYVPLPSYFLISDDGWWPARYVLVAAFAATFVFLILIVAWGGGLLWRLVLHGRSSRLAQARAEALAASEAERVRIARDMHDVVAHSLAVVIAQADGARYAAKTHPDVASEALSTIAATARSALTDVRLLLTQLRHQQGAGPQPTLSDLDSLFAHVHQAGVDLRVTVDPTPPGEPPASIQLAVYRIIQEALTNALRHGQTGQPVEVTLSWWADAVELTVVNTVIPAPPSRSERPHPLPPSHTTVGDGHGIIGMTERAQLVGGMLSAEQTAELFVVRARLPIGAV